MLKVSERDIFAGFQTHFVKINLLFLKKAVPHATTPMHCKARQVLHDLLVLTKEMAPK